MGRDRKDGGGYIALWRSFREHPSYFTQQRRPATTQEAILDLWLSATHKDQDVMSQGEMIHLERGQVLTSILALSKRWRWSRGRVSHLLDLCSDRAELVQKRYTRRTVITICNYDKWQNVRAHNGTTERQLNDSRMTTERHVQESEPSEPPNNLTIRPEADGRVLGAEPHPRPASVPTWWDEALPERLINQCKNIALNLKAIHVVSGEHASKMRKLAMERDPETIVEVFTYFVKTRRKTIQITFHNFFTYYEQHEYFAVKSLVKEPQ